MKPDSLYLLLAVVIILIAYQWARNQEGLKLTLPKKPRSPFSSAPVIARWGAIVAALLFIAFAFNVVDLFPRKVMLTWFVVTSVSLCLLQMARLR